MAEVAVGVVQYRDQNGCAKDTRRGWGCKLGESGTYVLRSSTSEANPTIQSADGAVPSG